MVALFVVAVKHPVPVVVEAGLCVVASAALGAGLALAVVGAGQGSFVFHVLSIDQNVGFRKGGGRTRWFGYPNLSQNAIRDQDPDSRS